MKKFIILLCLFSAFIFSGNAWSWTLDGHQFLANDIRYKLELPEPPTKRCEEPVDYSFIYALKEGAIEPDLQDGMSTSKHSYNKKYDPTYWDPKIKEKLGYINEAVVIGPGDALKAIEEEKKRIKDFSSLLTCNSDQQNYETIWRYFGRLSHYAADLASPLHTYSVVVDGKYREGDFINDEWVPGLFDDVMGLGKISHMYTEIAMGDALSSGMYTSAGSKTPESVALESRILDGYTSKLGNGTGFTALVSDYLHININLDFFKEKGRQQGILGESAILNVWQEAKSGSVFPSNCDEGESGDCEDNDNSPGRDHPDDNFTVGGYAVPQTDGEKIEQNWNRLAVKKDKKSIIWFRMQRYLFDLNSFGLIDDATYQSLKNSYGLTNDTAWARFHDDFITAPDAAILGRGFSLSMSDLLQNTFYEPVRRFNVNDFSPEALKDYPMFIIPSGGLMGLENSELFKANLDEYVRRGGTLIVFSQQHGYEFNVLPTPDGNKVSGFGWTEDQSCFSNSVYIDTYHQILSGQAKSTPSFNVDGYLTTYPSNSTVLLRRTANGQPAMIMYSHGSGRVIATSMFSDFAFKSGQASSEEKTFIRDLVSWAKKADTLPEVRPGGTASLTLSIKNNTARDASSVKVVVYNPDRSTKLSEETRSITVASGQTAEISASYQTNANSELGIYHIDYVLLDGQGNTLQPEGETDSGRFIVSNPATSYYQTGSFNFSATSGSERVVYGGSALFTVHAWNNTGSDRTLTAKYVFPHHYIITNDTSYGVYKGSYEAGTDDQWLVKNITVPANGKTSFDHLMLNTLRDEFIYVNFYDESGKYLGSTKRGFYMYYPSATVSTKTDRALYRKNDTASTTVSIKNSAPDPWEASVNTKVYNPSGFMICEDSRNLSMTANETTNFDFPCAFSSYNGTHKIRTYVYGSNGNYISNSAGTFEVGESQITITPKFPTAFASGVNAVSFDLNNTGKGDVTSGSFDLALTDPEGVTVYSSTEAFTLTVGETKTLTFQVNVPQLKFGNYTLNYRQSDESKTGSQIAANLSMLEMRAEASGTAYGYYRVRDTLILNLYLSSGAFKVENMAVNVALTGVNYSDSKTITIDAYNQTALNYQIVIPDTMAAGKHILNVTIALPSGSTMSRTVEISVPESSVNIAYNGSTTLSAGEIINIAASNTGGVDADVSYSMSLKGTGATLYEGVLADTLPSAATKTVSLQVPTQAAYGSNYVLNVEATNQKNGQKSALNHSITVQGVSAIVSAQTQKAALLNTENIEVAATISNKAYPIENGTFLIKVINKCTAGDQTCQETVVWQTESAVSLAAYTAQNLNYTLNPIAGGGQFYLQSVLETSTGQTISTTEYPFSVATGNIGLRLQTDKVKYRPGELVTIIGEAVNMYPIAISGADLTVSDGTGTLLSKNLDLSANGSYPISIQTVASSEGTVVITGILAQNSTYVENKISYEVIKPNVQMTISAPDIAGNDPFNIDVEVENIGNIDAEISYVASGGDLNDHQNINIPVGEKKIFKYAQQITTNTEFYFDAYVYYSTVEPRIYKTVTYGLGANIVIGNSNPAYPEGKNSIPVTIANTGQIDEKIDVTFEIYKIGVSGVVFQETRSYYLQKGASLQDAVSIDLPLGWYWITAKTSKPSSYAYNSLHIAKENDISITRLFICGADWICRWGGSPGQITGSGYLFNDGWNTLDGKLKISVLNQNTEIWNSERDVTQIASNSNYPFDFVIDTSSFNPGTYTLKVAAYNTAEQELASQSLQFVLTAPQFMMTSKPSYQTFSPGQEATFNFSIMNTGNQEGEVKLSFSSEDLIDISKTELIKSGEVKQFSFSFIVPDDIEEKDYIAEYNLNGQTSQIKYHVTGVNLSVNATLDRQSYNAGDTAHLQLQVTTSQAGGQNLFARVNYAGHEETKAFTLNGTETLSFDIPLDSITGEKLFYGIYHETGRSIHLNSLYIYDAGGVISLSTDKQVYNPGETVLVTLSGSVAGTLELSGPGDYAETFAFTGSATKSFVLPSTMTAGTYYITYQFSDSTGNVTSGSYPFDISGIQVKVKEAGLDKAKYASSDTLKLSLNIESNQGLSATLKTWVVDPSGSYTKTGEQGITLSSTEALIFTFNTSFNTSESGIHKLVYGIYYGDVLLSSGAEAFDVGDAILSGLSTSKASYGSNTEPVDATASLYGTVNANLEFYLDGQLAKTDSVSLSGYATQSIQLNSVAPGSHTLKAVLTAGGLTSSRETSFTYGADLPDLTVSLSYDSSQLASNLVKINVSAANQGRSSANPVNIAVYDGDPTSGGRSLGTINMGSINSGATASGAIDWNVSGYAGNHTVYAIVDPSNSVVEFNETNNSSTLSITVPNVIVALSMSESSYSSGEEIYINGYATNLSASTNYAGAQVTTQISNSQGILVHSDTQTVTLAPLSTVSTAVKWNTTGQPLGTYTVSETFSDSQQTLATAQASLSLVNSIPTIQLLTPAGGETITGTYDITWQASDPDANTLNVDIAYSNDGGTNWVYIANNIANSGSYSWDTSALPDGSNYKIMVIVKDGVATASAQSGAFSLLNAGALKVNSVPSGAKVYLGGNYEYLGSYMGVTGLNIQTIKAGKYVLRLTYPGYNALYQLINVAAGQEMQITANLAQMATAAYTSGEKMYSLGSVIDAGSYSVPIVIDWNMDGKKDLIIGNSYGQILYYQNTGTDETPAFDMAPGTVLNAGQYAAPFIVDWDNDGKKDIIAGTSTGDVLFFKNNTADAGSGFDGGVTIARVNNSAMPFVIDWNSDGKKDLLIGAGDGILTLYLNQNTDGSPSFNSTPDSSYTFPGVANLAPFVITDWNGDGKKDMLVGSNNGSLYLYLNTNTDESPAFGSGQQITGANVYANSTPFVVDWNNDGYMDILAGNADGELYIFKGSQYSLDATIDLDPDTLSKKSKGQWVTCYIELPSGYSPSDIDVSSLLLQGVIPAESQPATTGDYDSDGVSDLMVKFDRQRLQGLLSTGDAVKVTLTGRLNNSRNIKGEVYIRVTN